MANAVHVISDAISRHGRVALLYSGGLESSLLLHLAEPERASITAYTVRTGAEFPHMVDFIDRKLVGWDHRIIRTDLAKSFREFGIPASVVPIEHNPVTASMLNAEERSPRIVPWPACCLKNRSVPGWEAAKADGLTAVLYGQRAGDFAKPELASCPGLEIVAPLWAVTRAEVQAAIDHLNVELPEHYSEYPSSLDCSVCPSSLTTKRRAWMAKRCPEALSVAEGLHNEVTKAAFSALDGDNTKNAFVVT
ncbi:phosphoadenosine phosphosulfate reductase family protein [Bradyrhizobium sp. B120]|uniref:phosphoadenosine phosphosulfate reductase domain-containing protein n=1 Tax=Bradyrhizobium sp. B120 TaxID=3410088 RepID=UPI003B981C7F